MPPYPNPLPEPLMVNRLTPMPLPIIMMPQKAHNTPKKITATETW